MPAGFRGPFADRRSAGVDLAEAVSRLLGHRTDAVVLGIPRGGVEVADAVAERLGAPLDVVVPRKIGAPGNPELGLGAVAGDVTILDERMVAALGVTEEYLRAEVSAQRREIARRSSLYRAGAGPIPLRGRVAVVVDDGIATGGTARAAVEWCRRAGARMVVLAVPVAPREAVRRLGEAADRVVALVTPPDFFAVGQWYLSFPQASDTEVVAILERARARAAGPGIRHNPRESGQGSRSGSGEVEESMPRALSYERDVKALFRESDRESMEFAFDLWSYGDVKENAAAILERLEDGDMPCDAPWPPERIATFREWRDGGMAP